MNSETKTVKIAKAIITNNPQKIEVFDNIKAIHRPFVSSFYNVLKKNLTENELTNFYNNISTLTIKYKDDILTKLKLNNTKPYFSPLAFLVKKNLCVLSKKTISNGYLIKKV